MYSHRIHIHIDMSTIGAGSRHYNVSLRAEVESFPFNYEISEAFLHFIVDAN